jgi:hypothetical protein
VCVLGHERYDELLLVAGVALANAALASNCEARVDAALGLVEASLHAAITKAARARTAPVAVFEILKRRDGMMRRSSVSGRSCAEQNGCRPAAVRHTSITSNSACSHRKPSQISDFASVLFLLPGCSDP